jgi:thiamine biosynthesis lipoprotein
VSAPAAAPVRRVEHVMGMPVTIALRDAGVPAGALDEAFEWLRFVDATFSTYRPDSEISRLNRGLLSPADAHPLVRTVLERCERLRVETGGAFDARALLPGRLDPSGVVKGWAVEQAAARLAEAGVSRFCIDAAGDVRVHGDAPWRIGIRHPRRRRRLAAVVALADGAVATSGAYERGDHIVDPRTGRPAKGLLSATVVGPDLGAADAYATAAFALGPDGPTWTATLDGYEAMTIRADETVLTTPGFARYRAG